MGWPHPDYLLKFLTPKQFAEWAAFYNLEPWGFEVEDHRLGIIAASLFRAQGNKEAQPRDFMMRPPEEEVLSGKALVEQLKAAFGGAIEKKKE